MNVAVVIPVYNEELTIQKVVKDFRKQIPDAEIYVCDNNSNDRSVEEAEQAGAVIMRENRQGKGYVVRRMFSEIEADYYVLVDGDDTYPAEYVREMLEVVADGRADMVNGDRLSNGSYMQENKRVFHDFGNHLVRRGINFLFHSDIKDIMTGYRVFNRKFVKNIPVMSKGFEIETEMTIHALHRGFMIKEIPIQYRDRPKGSVSKLHTLSDGVKVLKTIITVFKDYKPLAFFGVLAVIVGISGFFSGVPVLYEYIMIGYIRHIPLTVLAAALEMLAINLLTCGLILDTSVKNDKKNYELRMIDYMIQNKND